jgi:hypothetical protein
MLLPTPKTTASKYCACDGACLRTIGNRRIGNGQFESPRVVAVDRNGHIIVTDTENNRIRIFK